MIKLALIDNGIPYHMRNNRRNRIAVISQRPYLFQGTIEENVNIDGKASRDAVVEACRKSGALGFIEKLDLDKKLDKMVQNFLEEKDKR